ncbi:MAG: hypothetical protein J7J87_02070 [Candidatus Diapherotrites archaeon]|nr:hypothetical protein [Candidatus Diapherotrites archaeon]
MMPVKKRDNEHCKKIYAKLKEGRVVSDDCPAFTKSGLILRSPHRP